MRLPIISARVPVKDFDAVNLRAKEEQLCRQAIVMKALKAYLETPVTS